MATESPHLGVDTQAKWLEIAKTSAAVISVTQRKTGLWPYPVSEEEVLKYHDGSVDHAFHEPYESITASWSMLLGLERLYSQIPVRIRVGVERWFHENPPVEGAYGRRIRGSLSEASRVDPSARHTAYALLIRLRFLPQYRPEEWQTVVNWIVAHKTPGGGWPYRPDERQDDPMSTAACVAALAYFLTLRAAEIAPLCRENIRNALGEGTTNLLSLTDKSWLWKGHRPGHTDVLDSALIIELLALSQVRSQLESLSVGFELALRRIRKTMIASTVGRGWPASFDGTEESLAATINGLLVCLESLARDRDSSVQAHFKVICDYIIEQLELRGGGSWLLSWEWAYLGSLSSSILLMTRRQLSEAEQRKLERNTRKITQRTYLVSKLGPLSALPPLCYGPVAYVISKGRITLEKDRSQVFNLAKRTILVFATLWKVLSAFKTIGLLQRT